MAGFARITNFASTNLIENRIEGAECRAWFLFEVSRYKQFALVFGVENSRELVAVGFNFDRWLANILARQCEHEVSKKIARPPAAKRTAERQDSSATPATAANLFNPVESARSIVTVV